MRNEMLVVMVSVVTCIGCGADPVPSAPETDRSVASPEPERSIPASAAPPSMIVAQRAEFIPEGVEYDTTNSRFLTGSISEGSVLEIHSDGQVTVAVSDPELISSVGIEVDEPNDRLLVANSDRSVFQNEGAGQAKLGVYNLTTGERIAMVDLAASVADAPSDAAYFANDVAVADDGTAYVTDTRLGVVYRVGPDYVASVLHRFEGFGPNGIVHHPAGYLLVCGGTALWRVPVDNPAGATQVTLPEEIAGQDGMVWMSDGRLAIVSNAANRVVALTSDDGWTTAEVAGVAPYETQATTAAVVGDDVYVVHPHFSDTAPPSIARVVFQ